MKKKEKKFLLHFDRKLIKMQCPIKQALNDDLARYDQKIY